MKICQTCFSYIPKQHYQYESSLLEVACALCRISFDFHLRKIKTDSCEHASILKDDCKSCHTFKCASMGMSTQRILLGKYVYKLPKCSAVLEVNNSLLSLLLEPLVRSGAVVR